MTFTERFVLRAMSVGSRLHRVWRALSPERRLAAYAAGGLFIALFFPWYDESVVVKVGRKALQSQSVSLTGWGVFGFLELIVLLVAVGVLVLLFERAEGNKFQLPGGDGAAILATGGVTCLLIIWGMFDKPGAGGQGQYATATGLDWGIFIVLAVAALLTYAGSRIRTAPVADTPPPRGNGPARTSPPKTPKTPPPKAAPDPSQPRRRARPPGPTTTAASAAATPATAAGAGAAAIEHDPDATKISARSGAAYDRPTPISNRKPAAKDETPTRVSTRKPSPDEDTAESPTRRFGPPVVPEDPPTLRISRRRPPRPTDLG